MTRHDPPERDSIFARPEDDDVRPRPSDRDDAGYRPPADRGPAARYPAAAAPDGWMPADRGPRHTARELSGRRGPNAAALAAVGGAAVLIIVLIGFIGASLLQDDPEAAGIDASATASSSGESAAPSEAPATASVSPSPSSTPAEPPHELDPGGWAAVTVGELNIRGEPAINGAVDYRLVHGAVVHLADERPTESDGLAWYRIASLGGARGWAASGPASSPYLEMMSPGGDFSHCGVVESAVLNVAGDGAITAIDPIRLGGIALPGAAFDAEELGALELARATETPDACVTATLGGDGPELSAEFFYYACGRAELHPTGLVTLVPDSSFEVRPELRVKTTAIVHPGLIARRGPDEPISQIFEGVWRFMALGDANGCLDHIVGDRIALQTHQCTVVESVDAQTATLRPWRSDESVTIPLTRDSIVSPQPEQYDAAWSLTWAFDGGGRTGVEVLHLSGCT